MTDISHAKAPLAHASCLSQSNASRDIRYCVSSHRFADCARCPAVFCWHVQERSAGPHSSCVSRCACGGTSSGLQAPLTAPAPARLPRAHRPRTAMPLRWQPAARGRARGGSCACWSSCWPCSHWRWHSRAAGPHARCSGAPCRAAQRLVPLLSRVQSHLLLSFLAMSL